MISYVRVLIQDTFLEQGVFVPHLKKDYGSRYVPQSRVFAVYAFQTERRPPAEATLLEVHLPGLLPTLIFTPPY